MSLLSDVLGGDLKSGVYHWLADLEDQELDEITGKAGWRFVDLDTGDAVEKAAILEACRNAFGFPHWTGRNYDALVDALRDVKGPSGVLVLWEGWQSVARGNPSVFGTVVSIMKRRGEFTPGGAFVVFLRR